MTYGGSCSSSSTSATADNNTVTFNTLSVATYSDCTIKVTDSAGNFSNTLTISTFVIVVWKQESYIKAANNDAGDSFGYSVSISGDTMVVGAFREGSNQTTITNGTTASSNDSNSESGAVYVYKRTGTSWAQEAYIKAANNDAGDYFGISVSISGDTMVVGASREGSNQTTITNGTNASSDDSSTNGAVYVYKRTGTNWAQEAYIKAANGDSSDSFGERVSIDNDTIVVGAIYEKSNQTTITNGTTASSDDSNTQSGAVYVYKRTGTSWAQEAYIKAANNDAGDLFGISVSISGDTMVVGAFNEDSNQTTITNGTT
ncbi:MAG: FG-GAP repeat protein, partial [SAR324 cluster bacterium]|nr:FG-GAP repeat protein [SAR324 cluster bacterium]